MRQRFISATLITIILVRILANISSVVYPGMYFAANAFCWWLMTIVLWLPFILRGKSICYLCGILFGLALLNLLDTAFYPTHCIISSDRVYFIADALGWALAGISIVVFFRKSNMGVKLLAQSLCVLTLSNLADELFGNPTAQEAWEFVVLWLLVCIQSVRYMEYLCDKDIPIPEGRKLL